MISQFFFFNHFQNLNVIFQYFAIFETFCVKITSKKSRPTIWYDFLCILEILGKFELNLKLLFCNFYKLYI